ncbi:MAG TPA: FAD-dependent oxidoreductase [Terriglobia bacterium]|nr:FAD-dependent oxidoreductase [Terriglobia bacterium]
MQTVILGAGISGLSAAHALEEVCPGSYGIYEQGATVGGLCRTQQVDGFRFDTVSHVLHFRSQETEQLVHQLLDGDLIRQERSAWIYFQGRYVPYPFQTHLSALPAAAQAACVGGYLTAWIKRKLGGECEPENFGEWVEQHFGSGIARHFMRPYNQKLWGIEPEQMSLDWIRPFVPKTELGQVISNLVSRRNHHQLGYNPWFFYPKQGGIQALSEAFRRRLAEEVRLEHEAVEIDLERHTVRFQDGGQVGYERLISTMPLPRLIERARGMPEELRREAAGLRWTSLLNLTYCLRRPLPRPFHWVYFPEAEYPFFRLVFPSNICGELAPEGGGLIAAEISNPEPGREEELERRVMVCLERLGWIAHPADVVRVVRNHFPYAYPVHDLERARRVRRLLDFLESKQVWSIGRFGAWRYSSIDDAITEALRGVPKILESSPGSVLRNDATHPAP